MKIILNLLQVVKQLLIRKKNIAIKVKYINSTLTYYILQRFFSLFAPTLKGAN